ncbi:MAG: DUF4351 domain-containing protein [Pseudomonadota bacterium]
MSDITNPHLSAATDKVTLEDYRRAVLEAFPETGDKFMTRMAEQWIEEGMRKGLSEGRREGISEGRRQEAASLMIRMLLRKFSDIDLKVLDQVGRLPVEGLERPGEDLFDSPDTAALAEWLDAAESPDPRC